MDDVVARIISKMKEHGLDQKTLAKKIGIRPQAITDWKTGFTTSYTKYLPQLAEILETSIDYLHTGKENVVQLHIPEEHLDNELVAELTSATPEEITQVRAYLQGLKAARKGPVSPEK